MSTLYFPLDPEVVKSQIYMTIDHIYSREVVRRKNFYWKNVYYLLLERFHHVLYLPCRYRALDKLVLLKPPTSFYIFTYLFSVVVLWIFSVTVSGGYEMVGNEISSAVGIIMWSIFIACTGSCLTMCINWYLLKSYT